MCLPLQQQGFYKSIPIIITWRMDINVQSTISLLKNVESKHPYAESINMICDNARYYRSKKVKEYLGKYKIKVVTLPSD